MPGRGVLRAQEVVHASLRLSIHDGFAFALAEINSGCILVTGDSDLRTIATQHGIEVHGLLWIVDQLHEHGVCKRDEIAAALRILERDASVRLPRRELLTWLRRYDT